MRIYDMTSSKKFHGLVVPMVTPVTTDGSLDEPAVGRIVEHLVDGGVDGVFILGTTGECASLPVEIRRQFAAAAAKHLRNRATLYMGIGDNCPARCAEAAKEVFSMGADAVVAHLPGYYPLQPSEMFAFYESLADRVEGPLLVYNIPATTHLSIPIDVVARLIPHPRIVGFKDSENSTERLEEVTRRLLGRDGFSLFIGAAALSGRGLLSGMDGVIPSSGNLDPLSWRTLCDAACQGDRPEVERLQGQLNRLAQVFQRNRTLGQSLAALKAAMCVRGLCGAAVLPPLREVEPSEMAAIRQELAALDPAL